MVPKLTREPLERCNRGDVTRRELSDEIDDYVGFGPLLALLGEHGLTLPRVPVDPNAPGILLIEELTRRAAPWDE